MIQNSDFITAITSKLKNNIPKLPTIINSNKNTPNLSTFNRHMRRTSYRILDDKVSIGQGCVFVGYPNQKLESHGFDTCAPFIMFTKGKRVFGHIDAHSTPEEIADTIKTHFSPKEIENASYHYFKGADIHAPGENLGQLAINIIEKALNILKVKGTYQGRLTCWDKVILDNKGIKLERFDKIEKEINL